MSQRSEGNRLAANGRQSSERDPQLSRLFSAASLAMTAPLLSLRPLRPSLPVLPVAHGYEFLRGRRVDRDSLVEVCLFRTASQRHRKALDNFACVGANHVASGDPVAFALDHQFHEGALVASAERMAQRAEMGLVDVDFTQALARLGFTQAHCRQTWLAEDSGWD